MENETHIHARAHRIYYTFDANTGDTLGNSIQGIFNLYELSRRWECGEWETVSVSHRKVLCCGGWKELIERAFLNYVSLFLPRYAESQNRTACNKEVPQHDIVENIAVELWRYLMKRFSYSYRIHYSKCIWGFEQTLRSLKMLSPVHTFVDPAVSNLLNLTCVYNIACMIMIKSSNYESAQYAWRIDFHQATLACTVISNQYKLQGSWWLIWRFCSSICWWCIHHRSGALFSALYIQLLTLKRASVKAWTDVTL